MAFHSGVILVITLLLIAYASTSSAAIINGGILGGVLTCTNMSLSTAGTYPVIPQARVDLVCGNGSLAKVVQSAVTNTAGVYNFLITTLDSVLNDPGSCYLNVTILLASCTFNIPTAVLRGPVVVHSALDMLIGKLLSRAVIFLPQAHLIIHICQ